MSLRLSSIVLGILLVAACGGDDDGVTPDGGTTPDGGGPADGGPPPADSGRNFPHSVGGDRPARVVVPASYDGTTPTPLMILLHGYTASAVAQDAYWRMSQQARADGFLLVLPDGTIDSTGSHFWNATPACCDFGGTGVDDVAYLTGLVHEMKMEFNVDPARVYFLGHSNGGFMSYRMACELADEVTAIMSLAGSDFIGDMDCVPSQPVSVLQVQGTMDDTIAYDGSAGAYPPAPDVVQRWAERAGCDTSMPTTGTPMDLEEELPGAETTVTDYTTGCMPNVDASLWAMQGGGHIPIVNDTWAPAITAWLLRHHR